MRISEVSELYSLTPDTLRYYEKVGLLTDIARDKSGARDYSEADLNRIRFVKCMRAAGLSIDSLLNYFHLEGQEDCDQKRHELLLREREKLVARLKEMNDSLNLLNEKINLLQR